MNFIKHNWQKIVFFFYVSILPVMAAAIETVDAPVVPCNKAGGKICPTIGEGSIPEFIHTILVGAIKIGIPVIALAIIYSGFLFVFARGNSEKLTKAKDTLLYTLIGAAILLGSWAIATLIQNTVNGLGA
ncbi:MAG: hypothetical protein WCT44_03730 [Candidatus Paceibacterota bacterium]